MSSRETMGTEILLEERNKSCLVLRSLLPQPLKNSHPSSLGLELCLCCKGEKIMICCSEFNKMSGPQRNKMKEKITSYLFVFY